MSNRIPDDEFDRLASLLMEPDSVTESRELVSSNVSQTAAPAPRYEIEGTEIVSQEEYWRRELAALQQRLETAKAAVRVAVAEKQAFIRAARMRMKRAVTPDDGDRMKEHAAVLAATAEITRMRQTARVKLEPLRNKIRLARTTLKAYRDG